MTILAARAEAAAAAAPSCVHAAEQLGEEVAEIGAVRAGETGPGKLEADVPVGRRAELLVRLIAFAEPIVGGAPLRIGEHGVGLVDLLHAALGIRLLRHVRMVSARQLAVVLSDLVGVRRARHAENPVVILEFHLPRLSRFQFIQAINRRSATAFKMPLKSSAGVPIFPARPPDRPAASVASERR
jgi:hypothetical protein